MGAGGGIRIAHEPPPATVEREYLSYHDPANYHCRERRRASPDCEWSEWTEVSCGTEYREGTRIGRLDNRRII